MTRRPPSTRLPSLAAPLLRAFLRRGAVAALACLPGLLYPAASRGQAFNLGVRIDLAMGTYPAFVAVADMNGDGTPDLVSTNSQDHNMSIQLGLGGGAYAPRVNYATGGNPLCVVVADFNRDGRPDVATSNFDAGTLSIFLGNGAGGLGPRVDLTAEFRPRSITVADMNGDNLLDLVVPNYGAGNLSVFLGNGNGTFAPRTNYGSFSGATCIATPDLNGDGRPDVVVTNNLGTTISVLLANPGGGFGAQTNYSVGGGSNPHWVATGDLNNDGFDDVAVADYAINLFSVFLGDGTGALLPKTDFAAGGNPISIALVDMNADGIADVVTALAAGLVSVHAGNGSGGFGAGTTVAVGSGPYIATVADLNGDGRLDIVTPNLTSNSLSVLLGNGASLWGTPTVYPPNLFYGESMAIGDATGDGKPDLVAPSASCYYALLKGDGLGGFGPFTAFDCSNNPEAVVIADVNLDGKPDLVTADFPENAVRVLMGNGAGGFAAAISLASGAGPMSVAVGDVNRDGKPDIVSANNTAQNASVFLGDGTGGFGAAIPTAGVPFANAIKIANIDHDAWIDLVVTGGPGIVVLHGVGGGSFPTATSTAIANGSLSLAVADLNSDGNPDVAVTNYPTATATVLLGSPSGVFGAPIVLATGALPENVSMGDLNGDGRVDLATANINALYATTYYGNGTGGFGPRIDVPSVSGQKFLAIGEASGDGRPDLVLGAYAGIEVHLGLTPTRTSLAVSPVPAVLGAPITLTATISVVAPGSGAPSGTVRFFDGTNLLGTSPVGGGVAALALFAPRLGTRTLTAVYNGDGKFSGSFSSPKTLQVVSAATAQITGIVDVPNDQGYQVRMTFNASPFDFLGSPTPIANYLLYRKIDTAPQSLTASLAAAVAVAPREATPSAVELAGWDFLMTIPATADKVYEAVVPTLINGAGNLSTFFVRATLATPGLFYDSPQAQGYSLDNLPPGPPTPFLAAYVGGATHLHWGANLEPDLASYKIYKGSSAGFVPGPGNLVATDPDTGFVDAGSAGSYYKISATDVNGNESGYTLLTPQGTLDAGNGGSLQFALEGARPNPARGARLNVWFSLPSADAARLELLDVSGRRVADREVGSLGAGQHLADLSEGRALPAGIYLVRLTQGPNSRVARVAVVE